MTQLLETFLQYLIGSAILFVVFFVVFAAVFAGGRLGAFVRGLARVLFAIVTSPFVFLRKSIEAVLASTSDEERRSRASEQYLLNRALLVLQALVIVVAIGALAAGTVMTWNAWVPPSEVRDDAKHYAKEVESQQDTAAAAAKALSDLDAAWAQKQDSVVTRYRKERQQQVSEATKRITAVEGELGTYGSEYVAGRLGEIRSVIASRNPDSLEQLNYTKERIDRIVDNNWYWLSDWDRGALKRWNDAWFTNAVAAFQLANLSIDELRASEQPTFAAAKIRRDATAETLASMQETLKQKQEAASLKWKAAFWRALASFFTFLMFVWLAGATIELAWLGIRIADDVRRIREHRVPSNDVSVSDEPRLPIRESGTAAIAST